MNKVLLHPTPAGHVAWDATSARGRELAFLSLFKHLNDQGRYEGMDAVESQLYSMARNGNARAAEALLLLRKDKEPFFEVFVSATEEPKAPKRVVTVACPEALEDDIEITEGKVA